jgi:hypothetical protein
MDASHVTGAGLGALAGALLVGLLHHFHVTTISDADAALTGAAFAALGVGAAHAFWNIGVGPIFSRIVNGPAKPAVPPVVIPPGP